MESQELQVFDPVLLSHEECHWLLANLGTPPVVAIKTLPPIVNIKAVKPILDRVADLEQLQQHDGQAWIGIPALKEAILVYLREDAKWAADAKRSKHAPRFPSMYSFDSKGRAHIGGPGSDSGYVHTYFLPDGSRKPFAVPFVADEAFTWSPPGHTELPEKGLTVRADLNRWECFCGHTESFKPDSRASYNAARARMSKHLRKTTEEVEKHRELHTNEFGG